MSRIPKNININASESAEESEISHKDFRINSVEVGEYFPPIKHEAGSEDDLTLLHEGISTANSVHVSNSVEYKTDTVASAPIYQSIAVQHPIGDLKIETTDISQEEIKENAMNITPKKSLLKRTNSMNLSESDNSQKKLKKSNSLQKDQPKISVYFLKTKSMIG